MDKISLSECLKNIIDNRGKTCPSTDKGIPLIATNCIKEESIYPTFENVRYVSEETYCNWFRGHPTPGDILFVNKGTPGRVCLVPNPINFCIAQDMVALQVDDSVIYPPYLFAALRSRQVRKSIENMHVGTMIPHFKKGDFDLLQIPLPKKSIQIFIGNFYRTFSEKIFLNQKTNESLEEIAKALFKSWFINFDPVRAKAEGRSTGLPNEISDLFPDSFEESELGNIPNGWNVSKISDIFHSSDYVANGSFATLKENVQKVDTYNGKEAILLRFADFNKNWEDDFSYITQESYNFLDKSKVIPGDLVVCNVGDIGNFFRAPDLGLPMSLGPNGVLLKDFSVKGKLSNPFFYFLLSTNYFQFQLQAISSGSVQTKFNKTELRGLITLIPPKSLVKISTVLFSDILSKKDQLFKENRILKNIRDTILPKLISGKLRIKDAEKMIDKVGI